MAKVQKKKESVKHTENTAKKQKGNRKNNKSNGNGEKSKIVFTRDNINSHLVSYNENPGNYKLMGMLTYLFKEFYDTPAELLSKLKVLSSPKKPEINDSWLPTRIIKHLFVILGMKESIKTNLFELVRNNNFLSALVVELYFGTTIDDQAIVLDWLNSIFQEVLTVTEEKGYLGYNTYCEMIKRLGDKSNEERSEQERCDHLRAKVKEIYVGEDEPNGGVEDETIPKIQTDGVVIGRSGDEDSSFSLVSLNDDEQIARLDNELGKQLRTSIRNQNDDVYALQLLGCMERLIKANPVFDISFLSNLCYLYQFLPLSAQIRALIRMYTEKSCKKRDVFAMYQESALVLPALYDLFSVFRSYCGEAFNELFFIEIAIYAGHGLNIVNKIHPKIYYDFYKDSLGKDYETFLVALIRNEKDVGVLSGLLSSIDNAMVKACIEERIEAVNHREANPRKVRVKRKENTENVPEKKEEAAEMQAMKAEECDSQPVKKRTFADKVGAKIINDRTELKKKYRWKNYKEKKKAERQAKHEDTNESRPKITKRSLSEVSASNKKVRVSRSSNKRRG